MDFSEIAKDEYQIFLQFSYPEIRDLLMHFLTLISGTLVFSVTFSEKVIDYHAAKSTQRRIVFLSWVLLVVALGACGIGLYLNFIAAEEAIAAISGSGGQSFSGLLSNSYFFQDAAGLLFGMGLFALVVSVIFKKQSQEKVS